MVALPVSILRPPEENEVQNGLASHIESSPNPIKAHHLHACANHAKGTSLLINNVSAVTMD